MPLNDSNKTKHSEVCITTISDTLYCRTGTLIRLRYNMDTGHHTCLGGTDRRLGSSHCCLLMEQPGEAIGH